MKAENPNLVPVDHSTVLFWNTQANRTTMPWEKGKLEGPDFYYLLDWPLRPTCGMIYQYAWGNYYFDIRDVRRKGNFRKTEYAADLQFKQPFKALKLVAKQMAKVAAQHDLYDFMNDIVYMIDEQGLHKYTSIQRKGN